MKKVATIFYFILISLGALSQTVMVGDDQLEWNEGEIILNDGIKLKGLVRFNEKSGVLGFDDGKKTRVFNSRAVSSFTFFDGVYNRQRTFYTVTYEDTKGMKRPQFFEVLKEYKSLAVLSCDQPLDLKVKRTTYYDPFLNPTNPYYYGTKSVASQKEVIYFLDSTGDITPYLIVDNQEHLSHVSKKTKSKTKSKIVGEGFLEEYFNKHLKDVKEHAKKNNLHFDDKDELLLILNFYESISN